MPIFCFDVNFAVDGKLVPITRRISTSIGPVAEEIVLKRVEGSSENGTLWERAILSFAARPFSKWSPAVFFISVYCIPSPIPMSP